MACVFIQDWQTGKKVSIVRNDHPEPVYRTSPRPKQTPGPISLAQPDPAVMNRPKLHKNRGIHIPAA